MKGDQGQPCVGPLADHPKPMQLETSQLGREPCEMRVEKYGPGHAGSRGPFQVC